MQTEINPKRVEKNLIFLQSHDGILDMFFGLMLMAVALNDSFSYYDWLTPWYVRYLIIIIMVPFVLGKLLITSPRVGYVKLKPVAGGRKQLLTIFTVTGVVLTLLLLAAALFKVPGVNGAAVSFHPILEFALLLLLFGFVGWLTGLYTLLAIGIIMGFAWPIAGMIGLKSIAGLPAQIFTLALPGLVIFIFGLTEFIKFMREHPRKNLKADYEPE
jgi:hypothetical protein